MSEVHSGRMEAQMTRPQKALLRLYGWRRNASPRNLASLSSLPDLKPEMNPGKENQGLKY